MLLKVEPREEIRNTLYKMYRYGYSKMEVSLDSSDGIIVYVYRRKPPDGTVLIISQQAKECLYLNAVTTLTLNDKTIRRYFG